MLQRTLGLCVLFAGALCGADRMTLTGKVTDAAGKPIERATVMVFKAASSRVTALTAPPATPIAAKGRSRRRTGVSRSQV